MSTKKIFDGLEVLGFNNIDDLDIYKKKQNPNDKNDINSKTIDINELLFDKLVVCPVCNNEFKARTPKVNAPRMQGKDSDFCIRYDVINPYFYDVWLCPKCGYTAMKIDFPKIRGYQIDLVKDNITSKWNGRNYPNIYDEKIAIERYKLALLNSIVIDSKDSTKAMICLKIAWIYRTLKNTNLEKTFLIKAYEGFENAYSNEDFPIYGLQRYSMIYLLGELKRRTGFNSEALRWFSEVITSPTAPQKIKEMARDMKDIIKENN